MHSALLLLVILACPLSPSLLAVHVEGQCGGRWWRRLSDGLLLREATGAPCAWSGGGSLWGELEVPSEELDESEASVGPQAAVSVTVELERGQQALYELLVPAAGKFEDVVAARFADEGKGCGQQKPRQPSDCRAAADLRARSEQIGQKFCDHPEAKEARALFCRYPPRFYGHAGICNQHAQFCAPQELLTEGDADRIETAVVNIDSSQFHYLEECGALRREVWIFKVFVHWCPHCQQLMPKLYRLALVLRQRGVTKLRFGAINCATEHELCASQKWPGHPLLVVRYLGPDRAIHDAIEYWVDIVKDAQLRQMLPRYALPGEFPVLKLLLEQLPASLVPKSAWSSLFEDGGEGDQAAGACPNMTALHVSHPEALEDSVGNAWSDVERDFSPRRRWTDALLMLRHILQEWMAPIGDDGNVHAFSHRQLLVMESFVRLLAKNLPSAFGLEHVLRDLQRSLLVRLRAVQTIQGGRLCASDWKDLSAPVLEKIAEVGQRDFSVPTACGTDTCRLWSLFHTLAAEGLRRQDVPSEHILARGLSLPSRPGVMLQTLRGFVEQFFKCLYCRQHFLEQFDAGSYNLAAALQDRREGVLYLWRLHSAVSVRVAAEHSCDAADRRWPSTSLCPSCWKSSSNQWPVLAETQKMDTGSRSPALQRSALPDEEEVLKFLMKSFLEPSSNETLTGPRQEKLMM